jgi:hypothetical protein
VRGDLTLGRLENMWGMASTGEHDAARVLYGRTRQFGNFMPGTSRCGGMPVILPTYDGSPGPAPTVLSGAEFSTNGDDLCDKSGKPATSSDLLSAALAASAGTIWQQRLPRLPHQQGLHIPPSKGCRHAVGKSCTENEKRGHMARD